MHLAIFITNTDSSNFALNWPGDEEKFNELVHSVRSEWTTEIFRVKDNIFPESLLDFDGFIIGGSPASVHNDFPWIDKLLKIIRDIQTLGKPIFGACFGHQAIALALGGEVNKNPLGWGHGLVENEIVNQPPWVEKKMLEAFSLYASHSEQVTKLPEKAIIIAKTKNCFVSSFIISTNIFTTQHHPEMSTKFFKALLEEMRDYIGFSETEKALNSLIRKPDNLIFAEELASFFEWAQHQNLGNSI